MPQMKLVNLTAAEACLILRRRAKVKQEVLADELGCSRRHLVLMESGRANVQLLVAYWSARQ